MKDCDCLVDPLGLVKRIVPFLVHRNSRVCLSALSAIDSIIRWRPWKNAFPIMSVLLGRREDPNMVELGEFYDDNFCTQNFIACLLLDSRKQIRNTIYKTIVDWVSELEDRADIELHLLPFILIGDLESEESVSYFQEKRCDAPEYVSRYARKFIPALLDRVDCDFFSITRENRDRLLIHTFNYLVPAGIVEHISGIFNLIEREGMNENYSPLLDLIVESGADWWNVLGIPQDTFVSPTKMELCVSLLRRGTIPEVAKNWFFENKNKLNF
jgi:hypothetical protein